MKEFFKKNGGTIIYATSIASMVSAAAAYIGWIIRSDKREIKQHKKLMDVYQSEIDFYRSGTKKES